MVAGVVPFGSSRRVDAWRERGNRVGWAAREDTHDGDRGVDSTVEVDRPCAEPEPAWALSWREAERLGGERQMARNVPRRAWWPGTSLTSRAT